MVYTIYMHLQSLISLDINNIDIDIKTLFSSNIGTISY